MRGRNVTRMSAGQPIKITVSGQAGSGKTSVIYVIADALRAAGVEVHLQSDSMLGQHLDGRALKNAAPVCTLIEQQTRRGVDGIDRGLSNMQRVALRCTEILPRSVNIYHVECVEATRGWAVRVRVGAANEQREFAGLGETLADAEAELYDRLVGW